MKHQDRPPEVYYYEWSVNRWRASETRALLNSAGRGIYREILDLCYVQGSIPKDIATLAKQCDCEPSEIEAIWAIISRHFYQDKHDKNRLRNKFSEVKRKTFFAHMKTQKQNASNGGAAKSRKSREISSGGSAQEKRILTNTILTAAAAVPPQQYGDWPEAVRAVHETFPDCELPFIESLARASAQTFAGISEPKCAFSDQLLADAIRRVRKSGQNSAGLFSRTVPACIRTWAAEGLPGQNSDGEVHY